MYLLTMYDSRAKVLHMAASELTSSEVAERLKVSPATVRLWCSQGKFKHAHLENHPRGSYWVIPERDLRGFEPPKMGRPAKQASKKGVKK